MCGAGEEYLPVDVLTGILACIPISRLTGDVRRIHHAFFELLPKYPGLSRSFIFVPAGTYHYSEELDGALRKLQLEGILAYENSGELVISPAARNKLGEFVSRRFTAEEREALQRLAEELEPLVRV